MIRASVLFGARQKLCLPRCFRLYKQSNKRLLLRVRMHVYVVYLNDSQNCNTYCIRSADISHRFTEHIFDSILLPTFVPIEPPFSRIRFLVTN